MDDSSLYWNLGILFSMTTFNLIVCVLGVLWLAAVNDKKTRWISRLSMLLVLFGAAIYRFGGEEYFYFSFYFIQVILLSVATGFFTKGRQQRLLMAMVLAILVCATIIRESLSLDFADSLEYMIMVAAAFSICPIFLYSAVSGQEESLEKLVALQQTWLRLGFFQWCINQSINIKHYDLFNKYIVIIGAVAFGAILLSLLFGRRVFWSLAVQGVLSLFIVTYELKMDPAINNVLFLWIVLLALSVMIPKRVFQKKENLFYILKRLEFGALGGGVSFAFVYLAHLSSQENVYGTLIWTAAAFIIGLFSWICFIPAPPDEDENLPHRALVFSRLILQAIGPVALLIWPLLGGN